MKPTPPPNGHTTRDQLRELRTKRRALEQAAAALRERIGEKPGDTVAQRALNTANGAAVLALVAVLAAVGACGMALVAVAR